MSSLLESFMRSPKGTILIIVALFNMLWVCYIVFIKDNFSKKIFRAYFFYSFFSLTWVISNAYFQSIFLIPFGEEGAKFMALLANISAIYAIIVFYYISSLFKNNGKKASWFNWIIMAIVGGQALYFNLTPNLTVEGVKIFEDGSFQLIFGPWNKFFFLAASFTIVLGFLNFLLALRQKRDALEKIKFFYILFSMSVMNGSIIIFSVLLPALFQNFSFVWIPPLLSILDLIIFGYSIFVKRFPSIQYLFSRSLKFSLAVLLSSASTFFIYQAFNFIFTGMPNFLVHMISSIMLITFYYSFLLLFHSPTFQKIFGITGVEYFQKILLAIQKKYIIYTTIGQFENDLQDAFSKKLHVTKVYLVTLNRKNRKSYLNLISYFQNQRKILITQEVQFSMIHEKRSSIFHSLFREISPLGEIFLPLHHPSGNLLGFLILGKKNLNSIYSKEEIQALQQITPHLSLQLTGIIYSSELQKAVHEKTLELHQKFELEREVSATLAHELKTPIAIAYNSLSLLDSQNYTPGEKEWKKRITVSQDALKRLNYICNSVMALREVDSLNTSGTHRLMIRYELSPILEIFERQAQTKGLTFNFDFHIEEGEFYGGGVQFEQVLTILLDNALKYTEKGSIDVKIESNNKLLRATVTDTGIGIPKNKRKIIFERFYRDHKGKNKHIHHVQGLGLGLYIADKIINHLNGTIRVKDNPDQKGTQFTIEIPIYQLRGKKAKLQPSLENIMQ